MTEPDRVPTVADIDRIAATRDPVVRNLCITQCYAELSAALAARTGGGANWCTFATWASRQAGQTIRSEDLARLIDRELEAAGEWRAAIDLLAAAARSLGADAAVAEVRAVVRSVVDVDAMAAHAAAAVARGNLKVFDEIARVFAQFQALPAAEFAAYTRTLRAGEAPDGQALLVDAFARYADALSTDDAAARAELLVLANLEIGLHEQIRLQPEIAESLNAAVPAAAELRDRVFARLFSGGRMLLRMRLAFWRMIGRPAPLDRALEAMVEEARRALRRAITSHVMALSFPDHVLRLGVDLGTDMPADLADPVNPALIALLKRIDPRPGDARGSGAIDWADLNERMHFIAELFRRFHEAPFLHSMPFTDQQMIEIRAGRRPAGDL